MNQEPETIKGKVKLVSKNKGLLMYDGKWINIDNTIKDKTNIEDLKELVDKDVIIETNSKGFYVDVYIDQDSDFKPADQMKTYKKVKSLCCNTEKELEEKMNKFNRENKVIATQTHIHGENQYMKFYAFVYYEVTE